MRHCTEAAETARRAMCESKTCHPTFARDFGKCWAISKILLLLNSAKIAILLI